MAKKKKILVITKTAWRDDNASGNTLSNFFYMWDEYEFYSIYCDSKTPRNDLSVSELRLTNKSILKSILTGSEFGEIISKKDATTATNHEIKNNGYFFTFVKKILQSTSIAYIIRELLWVLGLRNKSKINEYLNNVKPDIIFSFASDPIYLQDIIQYSVNYSGAKLFLFIADDILSYRSFLPFEILFRRLLKKKILLTCQFALKVYGASYMLCEEYSRHINKEVTPLFKSIYENKFVPKDYSYPIKLVYAGNLLYGREKIIIKIIDALKELNKSMYTVELDIYSTTIISNFLKKKLNQKGTSNLCSPLPHSEIVEKLSQADMVLFVESFSKSKTKITRLSFSTKIIDCFQSGNNMLAVGPSHIASVNYLKSVPGVYVITDIKKIEKGLINIFGNISLLASNSLKIREYSLKHHSYQLNANKMKMDFNQ